MCCGPRQGKVKKSQAGDGGLHAVGQVPGAAVPREPRAQMAEELQKQTKEEVEEVKCGADFISVVQNQNGVKLVAAIWLSGYHPFRTTKVSYTNCKILNNFFFLVHMWHHSSIRYSQVPHPVVKCN